MANNIKGITIEIGGDTRGLTNALKDVNSESKKVQGELKEVERSLKLDPSNVDLVNQKMQVLADGVNNAEAKLQTLRTAQSQVEQQFQRGEIGADQYRAFQRELLNTENSLTEYQRRLQNVQTEQTELKETTNAMNAFFDATGTSVRDFSQVLGTRLVNAIESGTATTAQMERAMRLMGRSALGTSADLDEVRRTLGSINNGGSVDDIRDQFRNMNRVVKTTQDELKDVESLLKLDPKNTVLLAQKQELLQKAIGETTDELEQLRRRQEQVERDFQNGNMGADEYREFQREIARAESELRRFERQLEDMDPDVDVDVDTDDVDKAEREMKGLGDTAERVGKKIGQGLKKGFEVGVKAAAAVGASMAASAIGAGAFVEANKELNMELAKLRTNANTAGFNLEKIEDGFKKVAEISGDTGAAVETVSNLMKTGFSDDQLSEAINHINGAAIAFSDTLKTEGIADGIQESFATGAATGAFGELLERSGVNLDDFNLGLAKAQKQGKETDYVLQQLAKTGLASNYTAFQEANKALIEYNEAQLESEIKATELATAMTPLATKMLKFKTYLMDIALGNVSLAEAFSELLKMLKDLAKRMFEAGQNLVKRFLNGIEKNSSKIADSAVNLMKTYLEYVTNTLPRVLEVGAQLVLKLVEGIVKAIPMLFEQFSKIIQNITEVIVTLMPQILSTGAIILKGIIDGITQTLPDLILVMLDMFTQIQATFVENLPMIVESGIEIINALVEGINEFLPTLVPVVVMILDTLINTLAENAPAIIEAGMQLLTALANGIINMLPTLIATALSLVVAIQSTIIKNLPQIIEAGFKILVALIKGIQNMTPNLLTLIWDIIKAVAKQFLEYDWSEIGIQMMKGLIGGIKSMAKGVVNAVSGVVGGAVKGAKNLLGIRSPSRVFMEIGEFTNEGFIAGIERTSKALHSAMDGVYGSIGASAEKSTTNAVAQQEFVAKNSTSDLPNILAAIQSLFTNQNQLTVDGMGQEIVVPVTLQIDGYTLAQQTVRYNGKAQYNENVIAERGRL